MIVASDQSFAHWLTFGSIAAYLLAAGMSHARSRIGRSGAAVLALAGLLHAATVAAGLTPPPRFGFAPALSMTALLALLAYAVESLRYPLLQLRWRLALSGAFTVLLAWLFPGRPLPPETTDWLPVHLALGMASYGLLALAVVHAWLMSRAERHMRGGIRTVEPDRPELPLLTLERLTFRLVVLGFVALTITIVQGLFFSEHIYGGAAASGWRWSHKTVFAMLSWLVFAALLWGRLRLGWRGQRAVRMIYGGAVFLLLSYAGSHFVLEVLLRRAAG